MTIYWWFLLFAIYFNSARKCMADVTPSSPSDSLPPLQPHLPRPSAVVAAVTIGSLPRLPAKVDAANKQRA